MSIDQRAKRANRSLPGFRHGVSAHYPVSIVMAGLPRGDAQSLRFHFHYRSYVFNFPDKIPFSSFRNVR